MTVQSGLGDRFFIGIYDVSGDIQALSKITGGGKPIDVTGIDKSAHERIIGERDGSIAFTTFHNPTSGQEHTALSGLPTTDVQVSYFRGTSIGNAAASCIAKQVGYNLKRGKNGELNFDAEAMANGYGLEWGLMATAGKRTDTTATAASGATSIDNGASSSFGLQAYLHVFSFAGTSVTVKLQHSTDNSTFTDVTAGSFTTTTGTTTERIATANNATINRYLGVTTTGTFTSAVFAVMVKRNAITPVF